LELLRSLIFVPGNRANMLERVREFNADTIMYDLEDSVPPAEKVNARDMARQWVPDLRIAGRRVMVRCNGLDTGLTRDELAAVIGPDLYGVSVGKTESSWDIQEIDRIIGPYEAAAGLEPGTIKLVPWIESAKAVMNAQQMAGASSRIIAIAFGAEDFTVDWAFSVLTAGRKSTSLVRLLPLPPVPPGSPHWTALTLRFAIQKDSRKTALLRGSWAITASSPYILRKSTPLTKPLVPTRKTWPMPVA